MLTTPRKGSSSSSGDAEEAEQVVEYSEEVLQTFSPTLGAMHSIKRKRSALGEAARVLTLTKSAKFAPNTPADCGGSNENSVNATNHTRFQSPLSKVRSATGPFSPQPETPGRFGTPNRRPITPGRRLMTPSRPVTPGRAAVAASPAPSPRVMRVNFCPEAEKHWKATDFTLGKPIGKGKFGNVYYAKKASKDRAVALKVLFKTHLHEEQALKMLSREVSIQHELRHEHILRLYGYFQDLKYVYLVLEYAGGGELYRHLRTLPHQFLEEQACKGYIKQILSALSHMHSHQIVHRDIKPENILLGGEGKILLGDFGSAVKLTEAEPIRYTICGTPEYLAPEMIVSAGHDRSLDMWACGVLLFELLYGKTPFVGPSLDKTVPDYQEREAQSRRKMYERIVQYEDKLFYPPCPHPISDQAKRVLGGLIRGDRRERMTAEQLGESDWLKE